MFDAIGRFAVRFAVPIVLFWLAATASAVVFLPSLSSVNQTQPDVFLPISAPSVQAAGLATPFQSPRLTASVVVAVDDHGQLTSPDLAAIGRAKAHIRALSAVKAVVDDGISHDRQADRVTIETSAGTFGRGNAAADAVDAIRRTFPRAEPPKSLQFHLTGELATQVDLNPFSNNSREEKETEVLSILFIVVLVLLVFRSLIAPLVALAPAALALVLSSPIIAQVARWGFPVSDFTQFMLIILVLGAGTDYGLFLIFRVREEMSRGLGPTEAVVHAVDRAGQAITFSASTVIVAFATLLLASLQLYRGLGLDLAIAIFFVLVVDLTLLPALLALFGKAVFWPSSPESGRRTGGRWGTIAAAVTDRPIPTLVAGVAALGVLALVAIDYSGGVGNPPLPSRSDSAIGMRAISAHFPTAESDPTPVLFAFPVSVWKYPDALAQAQRGLGAVPQFSAVAGALDPNGTPLSPEQLVTFHEELGRADRLPVIPRSGTRVAGQEYEAYRATAEFISPDGRTVQYDTSLVAGPSFSDKAVPTVPALRTAVARIGHGTGAFVSAVGGGATQGYDLVNISNHDLLTLVPVVLLLIGLLLVVLLRGLVAPLYLVATVGLSYLAALGLVVLIFKVIDGDAVVNFTAPFVMFIFLMAIGEDYNILIMNRIREETRHSTLNEAVRTAMIRTGATISSAGLILAGTFAVLTVATTGAARQIGVGVAVGILLDTFLVRTLMVPAIVVLLGRWNWWPSHLEDGTPEAVTMASRPGSP